MPKVAFIDVKGNQFSARALPIIGWLITEAVQWFSDRVEIDHQVEMRNHLKVFHTSHLHDLQAGAMMAGMSNQGVNCFSQLLHGWGTGSPEKGTSELVQAIEGFGEGDVVAVFGYLGWKNTQRGPESDYLLSFLRHFDIKVKLKGDWSPDAPWMAMVDTTAKTCEIRVAPINASM